MFATVRNQLSAYQRVCVETDVLTADSHKLVLMLFEGALLALADAQLHMQRRETAEKGLALSKALMIIDGGLKASLDVKAGGKLGEHLAALYDYMCDRLLHANLHNRVDIVEEIRQLLLGLRGAWLQISPEKTQPPVHQAYAAQSVVATQSSTSVLA